MKKSDFSIAASISSAWQLTKQNFIVMLGLLLAWIIIYSLISTLSQPNFSASFYIFNTINIVISFFFNLGYYKLLINATHDIEPEFSAFKGAMNRTVPYFVTSLLSAIIKIFTASIFLIPVVVYIMKSSSLVWEPNTMLTSLFFQYWYYFFLALIPAIYMSIRILYAPLIVIDKDVSGWEAIKLSWQITSGNVWKIVGLSLLLLLINILGFIALIIGVFVTLIISWFACATSYKSLIESWEQSMKTTQEKNTFEFPKSELE